MSIDLQADRKARLPVALNVGHLDLIHEITFSSDGNFLATSDMYGEVIVWELPSGNVRRRFVLDADWGTWLAFIPDAPHLAQSGNTGIHFWNVDSGAWEGTIPGDWQDVQFRPNGELIASDGRDLVILDWHSGQVLRRISFGIPANQYATLMCVSVDGSVAVAETPESHDYFVDERGFTQTRDSGVQLRDLDTGNLIRIYRAPALAPPYPGAPTPSRIRHAALSPTGDRLAGLSGTGQVWIFDTCTGPATGTFPTFREAESLLFSPDGSRLAVVNNEWWQPSIRVHTALAPHSAIDIPTSQHVDEIAFSPDGRTFVSAERDRVIRLWDLSTGKLQKKLRAVEYAAASVTWSADGRSLTADYSDGRQRHWEIDGGRLQPSSPDRPLATRAPRLERTSNGQKSVRSVDGTSLATAEWDPEKQVGVYHLRQCGVEKQLPTPCSPECGAWSMRFSTDGALLAAGGDGGIWLWDCGTQTLLASLYVPEVVEHLAVSPDHRYLAGGGFMRLAIYDRQRLDRNVLTYENYHPYIDACFRAHPPGLTDLEFSPNGRYLATCGKDAVARVWETGTWKLVAAFLILPDEQNAPSEDWISWNEAGVLAQSPHASAWIIPGSSRTGP